jgi:hypothetical protein
MTASTLFAGLIAIGLITTLVLPSHQTVPAITLASQVTSGDLSTLMGKGS